MNKSTKQSLVSVLIPVFNGAKFLEKTIESIQKSTYKNFEVILIDDGSTDESRKICHALEKRFKNIRFYFFEKNKGMTRSLNFGISKAKGKYIARINQDDLMVPSRLIKQVKFLEENLDCVAVGGYIRFFTDKTPNLDIVRFPLTDGKIRGNWLLLSPFSDPTVMYRKSAYLQTKGYSQKMWPADDVHMWYQLGQIGKLANLPTVLTKVRWHEGAGSIKYHKIQMKKTWKVHQWAKKNVGIPNLATQIFWVVQYAAGIIFPAQVNWYVYRLIRKLQGKSKLSRIIVKVSIHPTTESLSGV